MGMKNSSLATALWLVPVHVSHFWASLAGFGYRREWMPRVGGEGTAASEERVQAVATSMCAMGNSW